MKRWFTENLSLKLIAFLLALILHLFVRGDRDSALALYIPLSVNIPAERVLVSDTVDRLKVTVRGKRSALDALEREGLRPLSIDLSNVDEEYYEFSTDMLLLPPGIKVTSIQPPGFPVKLDRQGVKALEVLPRIVQRPAEGYKIISWNLNPQKVEVHGPMSTLEDLSAVVTEPIELTGRTQTFNTRIRVRSVSSQQVKITPNFVDIRIVIDPIEIQQTFTDIPVRVQNTHYIAVAEPAQVDVAVKGPTHILNSIDKGRLMAIVDATYEDGQPPNAFPKQVTITNLPKEVNVLKISPASVTLTTIEREAPTPDPNSPNDPEPHPDDK